MAGSSGGAAASVAGGLCAIAHGTDGAGSVRVPAAYCGLVGLKPTRGRVSFGPELGNAYYGSSVDGLLTRSVRDDAAVLDVLARPTEPFADGLDAAVADLRIGVCVEAPYGRVDDVCADAATSVGELPAPWGHRVVAAMPAWPLILEAAGGPMTAPGPAALVPLDRIDEVEPRSRPLVEARHQLTVADHARWVDLVRPRALEFMSLWDDIDVLVTPSAPILPPPVDFVSWDLPRDDHSARFLEHPLPSFAQPFNLTGQPGDEPPPGVDRRRPPHRRPARRAPRRRADAVAPRAEIGGGAALGGAAAGAWVSAVAGLGVSVKRNSKRLRPVGDIQVRKGNAVPRRDG